MANGTSTADLVNSTEFKRAVSLLVEDEINRLQQGARGNGDGSILNQFAGEVSVTGLSDAIKAKNKCVKGLWLLVFLGGLAAAAIFVYMVFEEYRNEPTATKVNITREANYTFPRVVLCVDTWLDAGKAMEMGLSKEGIKYALRYLIPFEDVATENVDDSKNISGLEEEFYRVYHQHNFSSLVEFFKYVALDAIWSSKNESQIGFTCSGCKKLDKLEKVIIDKQVCYEFYLKPVDGKLRQSYGLPEYEIRVPDLSRGILKRRAYWKLYVNPAGTHLMSDTPYVSIYDKQSHSVRIKSEHYEMVPKGDDPCAKDIEENFEPSLSCVLRCAWRVYLQVYNCSVLNLDMDHSRDLNEYCNTYYWTRWPRPQNIHPKTLRRAMLQCISNCKQECSIWWYSTTVDAHYSNSMVKDQDKWNSREGAIHVRLSKIYFINMDVLAGGVVTFTEVYTYSFQSLIGNIGGTCGIWIGASVMTLIQLCMFFIERSLDGLEVKKRKEPKTKIINGKEMEKGEKATLV